MDGNLIAVIIETHVFRITYHYRMMFKADSSYCNSIFTPCCTWIQSAGEEEQSYHFSLILPLYCIADPSDT